MEEIDFRAMGSSMRAVLDAPRAPARQALLQVPVWFEAWEQSMSRFRSDSELNRLNQLSGSPVQVTPELCEAILASLEAARATDGLVDPTLMDAMLAIGYDRSFELLAAGDSVPIHPVQPAPQGGWWDIRCDPDMGLVELPRGVHVDLGGIGKGWAADRAAHNLAAHGPALVDAGGDIAVSGPPSRGQGWPVAVTDPRQAGAPSLAMLVLRQGGVATSGRDFRRWKRHGEEMHHILDPQTRQPAETDVLSATVVGPSTLEAEAAAKAVLIQGAHAGMAWLEDRPQLAGLVVREDGRVEKSTRLERYLWS